MTRWKDMRVDELEHNTTVELVFAVRKNNSENRSASMKL